MVIQKPYRPWLEGLLPPEPILPTPTEREDLAQQLMITEPNAFVSEGALTLRELGWRGQTPLIPDGESAITALVMGPNGQLYGGTSGEKAHLFVYNPSAAAGGALARPLDLGILGEEERICRSLVALEDALYAGTMSDRLEGYRGGHLYRHRFSAETPRPVDPHGVPMFPFDPEAGLQVEDLGVPVDGEGIYALAGDGEGDFLYGLTYPGAQFFVYSLRDGSARVIGQVSQRNLSRTLIRAGNGHVYGSGDHGRLFRYMPEFDRIEFTDLRLPAVRGREYLNGLDSAIEAPDGTIYGGTIADGYLFRFDPHQERIVNLGKPIRQSRIRALAVTPDGRVYGFAGEQDNVGRLFVYMPAGGEMRELGIPRVGGVPKFWAGYEFESMATGPNGEIFMGESDRVSHLFIYYPPLPLSPPIEKGDYRKEA